jgi:hypothetical protein
MRGRKKVRKATTSFLEFCFPLFQVGVNRSADEFCHRCPCHAGQGLQLLKLTRLQEEACLLHVCIEAPLTHAVNGYRCITIVIYAYL